MKTQVKGAVKLNRYFTKQDIDPFAQFVYEQRSSIIRNPNGDIVFELKNVEVPKGFSQVATDILAQKYFRKAGVKQKDGSLGSETSVKQVVHRIVDCWRKWGSNYGYFETERDAQIFYDELVYCLLGQIAAPNSPQWFNTGLYESYGIKGAPQGHYYVDPNSEEIKRSTSAYERPQPHACFILSVKDNLVNDEGIIDLILREARIFKYGSGVGTNFSQIRGANEKLSGGGYSSGLMSFLRIGDRAAGAIKSGGTTRRAAKMVCLDLDHPEIEEFIGWKATEEKKVAALIKSGYDSSFEGEAYNTVSGQNSNNSVRVPDEFFAALKEKKSWKLIGRTDKKIIKEVPAQELWDKLAKAAWACADPGVQFDTTINQWHTCPEGGRINASNPCSEYMFLDDTACNLASINLKHFFDPETLTFDIEGLKYVSKLLTIALEISVLMAQFPSEKIAQLSYEYRTLGLGYANLGSVFMMAGIPYDSKEARTIAGALTAIMTGTAYKTSAEMAALLGPFKGYEKNAKHMLRVIKNHRKAVYGNEKYEGLNIKPYEIDSAVCPKDLYEAACRAWDDALELGQAHGYRNAQTTVIAPTGTIGLLMDCDTTGIEPDFALVKFKKLSGGGYFKIINQSIPVALKNLGYKKNEVTSIVNYVKGVPSFDKSPFVNKEALLEKGFNSQDIKTLNQAAEWAFDINSIFSPWVLGEKCFKSLGIPEEAYNNPNFNLLKHLEFSNAEIQEANKYICGAMTIEGAPFLKKEHYPIFDCANKCGETGSRYISFEGHINMMAAVQPFLSGAISKTINMPNEATVEDIKNCYHLSWQLGLKANAIYRDGCKMSQPLSTKSDSIKQDEPSKDIITKDLTPEQVIEAAKKIIDNSGDTTFMRELSKIVERKQLPQKRRGFTQKAKVGGQNLFVRTGEYSDGTLGEIFIDMHKEGASFRSLMNCFAIAVSIGLQYGVPLDEFVKKFTFTRFEPSGMVIGHDNIKSATSIIDYIFRLLGYEYLDRVDLVHVVANKQIDVLEDEIKNNKIIDSQKQVNKSKRAAVTESYSLEHANDFLKTLQSDSPSCSVCGHLTIRSGTCYKCLNCGNSIGCS
ncbi:MAG: vitamin B12-dependent ribonucleotide reductase [Solitalea-like symbiont of Tyrophagus putrescentiae]